MDKKLSYYSLKPHLQNLRISGYFQLDPNSPKLHKFYHNIYMRIIFILILLYFMQQILKVYEVRNDMDKVVQTMFLLLSYSDAIYKQIVFLMKADKIEELIEVMKGPIFNQGLAEHQKYLCQTVRQAHLLLRVYSSGCLLTCFLWVLYPLILYIQGTPVEFLIVLPFDVNISPHFYIAVIYVWLQMSWCAFNNGTMDAFISFSLAQCKTQLSILRLDLEALAERSKEEASSLKIPLSIVAQKGLLKIMNHYDEIVKFKERIQEVFGGVIFYQFLVSGWIICTTMYIIANVPTSVEFMSSIVYLFCMLTQLFCYCYFGNEVFYESELLIDSACAMNWLQMPIKTRKDLLIFMERIKRPIRPAVGLFSVPLSNTAFVSVLRSSYSFFALLNNTR